MAKVTWKGMSRTQASHLLVQLALLCTLLLQPLGSKLELPEGTDNLTQQRMPRDLTYKIKKYLLSFSSFSLINERD